ncbi:lipoprotein [Williamsoniiplasma luminosum]|uniref:Lipoprotein n=1 Tax=Williamsoniiplasma luminosum TaxID=214888 RepID=A0A2S0NJL2_9MOLU|nr:lipoprotein [Williamsoniiplasma luminosum]AVP49192.1 MAG: hypothetical protein C5T88_01160 [Williamsoniiplasma luminosum]
MKKLLMLLGSISIIVGSVSTVIACDNPTSIAQSIFENAIKTELDRANEITTQLTAEQYKIDFNDNKIKVEDVIIELNYISPTHAQPGSFHVVFTPTVVGKYNQAKEIKSSYNAIDYDVQAAFEAAINDELIYANEIKTRNVADNYNPAPISDVEISKNYVEPISPVMDGQFQAAFTPKKSGIYEKATPRVSSSNIIKYENSGIQKKFEAAIDDELALVNGIINHDKAEQYSQDLVDPYKIPGVKIILKYISPTFQDKGLFYVIFSPKTNGIYQGTDSVPSQKNQIKYQPQAALKKAIKEEIQRANNIKTEIAAGKYQKDFDSGKIKIRDVEIGIYWTSSTPNTKGSFQVVFSPKTNGIYQGANPIRSIKNDYDHIIVLKDYENAIEAIKKEAERINSKEKQEAFNKKYYLNNFQSNRDVIPGVEIKTSLGRDHVTRPWYFYINFKPIFGGIYSSVGIEVEIRREFYG